VPELPDLEVVKDNLTRRIAARTVEAVELRDPVLLRRPTVEVFRRELVGRRIQPLERYGKFLLFHFDPPARLILNLMLAGRFTLQPAADKLLRTTGFWLTLSGKLDLRYHDARSMGKLYLLLKGEPTALVPTFDDQGPDALDPALTFEVFRARLHKFHTFIKHVLLNQEFVAGIGNAYADEILYAAHILPFRKRSALTNLEIDALYNAMHAVLRNAMATIAARGDEALGNEVRDFLQVHGKGGQLCPSCGTAISSVKSGIKIANFCRKCQV
jgi:formamidopyrimidine-DNA glycosylase